MITDKEKLVYKLSEKLFSFLPPFPIQFSEGFDQIIVSENCSHQLYLERALRAAFIYASTCFSLIFWHVAIHPIRIYKLFPLLLHTCIVIGFGTIIYLCLTIKRNWTGIQNAYKGFIDLQNQPKLSKHRDLKDKYANRADQFLLLALPTVVLISIAVPISLVWMNIDVAYFIFEVVVQNPSIIFHPLITVVSILFRLLLNLPIFLEIYRTGYMLTLMVASVLLDGRRILLIILTRLSTPRDFLKYYTLFFICQLWIWECLNSVIFYAIGCTFWCSVVFIWMCVTGVQSGINLTLYVCCLSGALVAVVGASVILPLIAKTAILVEEHILFRNHQTYRLYKEYKTTGRLAEQKEMMAVKRMQFQFGHFFELKKDIVPTYFSQLSTRVCDMVLVFKA